jgi:hypothetical protein
MKVDVAMSYFEVMFLHFPGGTTENIEKSESG